MDIFQVNWGQKITALPCFLHLFPNTIFGAIITSLLKPEELCATNTNVNSYHIFLRIIFSKSITQIAQFMQPQQMHTIQMLSCNRAHQQKRYTVKNFSSSNPNKK